MRSCVPGAVLCDLAVGSDILGGQRSVQPVRPLAGSRCLETLGTVAAQVPSAGERVLRHGVQPRCASVGAGGGIVGIRPALSWCADICSMRLLRCDAGGVNGL